MNTPIWGTQNMSVTISLSCTVCGQPHSADPPANWARLVGYDCIGWIDPGAKRPRTGQQASTDICPDIGQSRIAQVSAPFDASADRPFWALFQPALSWINGWAEFPEEIDRSALVHCELTDVLEDNGDHAWVALRAIDVVPLPDLIQRFDRTEGSVDLSYAYPTAWETKARNWLLVEGNGEGDVGEWVLVHRRPDGDHLVLHARWDFHRSIVEAGNTRLKDGEADALCAAMTIVSPG